MASKKQSNQLTGYVGAKEISAALGLSYRVVLSALKSGAIAGRNMKGRRGYITTAEAVRAWVDAGNAASVPPA